MQEKNLTADYWKAVETLFPAAAQLIKELCDRIERLEADLRAKQIGNAAAEERTLARDALTKEVLVKMAGHSCSHPPTWAKELLKLWQ